MNVRIDYKNLGKLETGFFVGSGVIIMLFGIAIILVSCLGCQGMDNQTAKFGTFVISHHHRKGIYY